ncbi:tail fiber/spike domain-containing protein [Enterobacter hormaechei]|uniref:tail fiber/spike domain-containing protein n=1 Tax=Enterobacter hormaechei TaxID=158836 RepID=UPI00388F5EC0
MATTPTNLPVPSESPRDLKFNAGKIDEFVTSLVNTYVDRFGNEHYTIEGLRWLAQQAIAAFGWIPVGTFQDGATLTLPNQILKDETDGEYYRWDGALPKMVPSGSTPSSSGGTGVGAWVSVGDAALRSMLASGADGNGDALITVKQPLPGSVVRTQHNLNADYVNVKDWGAKGDGVTDDTAAINAACSSLTGTSFITNFRRLYFPHGTYVYKGTGIVLPNGTSLIGEDLFTTIDASANTNTGYLITLTGFRSRVDTIALKGNKDNPGMVGISSYYNSDNGGVLNCILEDFHYGIDIDKCWYSVYRNIRFRRSSSSVVLTGAHIRLGFNHPTEEVNNIDFSNIWLGEPQANGVAVYCPTQVLAWNECSFETKGGPRIKFFTTASVNTFTLNTCYLEGDIGSAGGAYVIEGQSIAQNVTMNDCMFRLGSTVGSFGKSITVYINGGFSNSPNVALNSNNAKIWFSRYNQYLFFSDSPDFGRTGIWDGAAINSGAIYLNPRQQEIRDWNSLMPTLVNTKLHSSTAAVDVFKVYVPSGTSSPRMMKLTLKISSKSSVTNFDMYNEAWEIFISLPEATASGSGTLRSRIFENGTTGMPSGTGGVAVVSNGYDSTTDAIVYTISHSSTVNCNSLYVIDGCYVEGGISTVTRRWKIQRM